MPIPRVPLRTPLWARAALVWARGLGVYSFLCLCFREKEIIKKKKAQESESTIAAREVRGLMDTIGEPLFDREGRPGFLPSASFPEPLPLGLLLNTGSWGGGKGLCTLGIYR